MKTSRKPRTSLSVTINFGGGPETFNILEILAIEKDVEEAYRNHASTYATFAAALEAAETELEGAEYDLAEVYDGLVVEVFAQLRDDNLPVTMLAKTSFLDAHIHRSDLWRKAKQRVMKAEPNITFCYLTIAKITVCSRQIGVSDSDGKLLRDLLGKGL